MARISSERYKSFPDFMSEVLLRPLDINDSTCRQNIFPNYEGRKSSGHPFKNVKIIGNYHNYPEMAAAGQWTTPQDLAKLIIE